MILVEAIYHRFDPFTLAGIKTIKITFSEMLQILNSTNGSGKSTFLKELNIFPVDKELFFEDGYKIVSVKADENSNLLYIFKSTAKGSNSCIERNLDTGDERELNKGGTQKVQLELAEELFNVTPFIWNIITGVTKFTNSDKNVRRKWMEELSGLDFDYAFSVHQNIVRAISERKGTVKMSSNHLTSESAKLLDEVKVTELGAELDRLNVIYRNMLSGSKTVTTDAHSILAKLEQLKKEINALNTRILKFKRVKGLNQIDAPALSEVDTLISVNKSRLDSFDEKRSILTKQLNEKQKLRESLKRTDGYNLPRVEHLLEQGRTRRQELLQELTEGTRELFPIERRDNWERTFNKLVGVKDSVVNWANGLSINNLTLPLDELTANSLLEENQNTKQRIGRGEVMLESLKEQLHHLQHTDDVTCPSCSTQFKPNVIVDDKTIIKKMESVTRTLTELKQLEKTSDTTLAEYRVVKTARDELTNIYYQAGLPELLNNLDLNVVSPYLCTHPITSVLEDRSKLDELKLVLVKLTQLEVIKIELTSNQLVGSSEEIQCAVDSLNNEISSILSDYDKTKKEITRLETQRVNLLQVKDYYLDLINKTELFFALRAQLKEELKSALTNNALKVINNRVGRLNNLLGDERVVRAIVDDLSTQINRYQLELEDYVLLEKSINPATGIIGDQLRECTNAFSSQLTKVVGNIWGYGLEILPCPEENIKGMDYKFPFKVEGHEKKPTSDVSKGSKSQKAIIDLGVQLTTRAVKGFNSMPLYLDEIGEGFDKVHNENLLVFLKQLLTDYKCSHMFLVHHDVRMRSLLGDFDMIVFHKDHVSVPDAYNEHVEITYY